MLSALPQPNVRSRTADTIQAPSTDAWARALGQLCAPFKPNTGLCLMDSSTMQLLSNFNRDPARKFMKKVMSLF